MKTSVNLRMIRELTFCVVLLVSLLLSLSSAHAQTNAATHMRPGNILVVVMDDVGVDSVRVYGNPTGSTPPTPNLDGLAFKGIRFNNAWATPFCSSTRASLQTGRYPVQHGIGSVMSSYDPTAFGIRDSEVSLAELVRTGTNDKYKTAHFGKWHISASNGSYPQGYNPIGANQQGYHRYAGFPINLAGGLNGQARTYTHFDFTVDGVTTVYNNTAYLPTLTVDHALNWVSQQTSPWLAVVGFNLAHTPFHAPPQHLHSYNLTGMTPNNGNQRIFYEAMVQAMDTEIGRLVSGINRRGTTVIIVGDNGTPQQAALPPFSTDRLKGTLYEGGINVPFIISGNGVTERGVSNGLVNVTDIFRTVAEITRVPMPAGTNYDSSVSLVPYMVTLNRPSVRTYNYSERFSTFGFDSNTGLSNGLPLSTPYQSGCQTDLGHSGPGAMTISICGAPITGEVRGDLVISNGPPNATVEVYRGGIVPPYSFNGGTFVVENGGSLKTYTLNAQGSLVVPGYIDANDIIIGGPTTVGIQASAQDLSQASGYQNSNALQVVKLPYNMKTVRNADGYKAIFNVNASDGNGGILTELYHLPSDPYENNNLYPPASGSIEEANLQALQAQLNQILATP